MLKYIPSVNVLRRHARLGWFASILLTSFAGWPAAAAQTSAEAAVARGIELRRQGKSDEALVEFQKAYQLAPSPRVRAQMGLAEQALGRWADAEHDLTEALSAVHDPWIERQRSVLAATVIVIGRHLGSVVVKGEPAGAFVELDGERVGTIPLPEYRVTAGEVVITVRRPGFVSVSRKVTVAPGGVAAEIFKLPHVEPEAPVVPLQPHDLPVGPGIPAHVAPPPDGPPPEPSPPLAEPTDAERKGNGLRTAAWITGAATVASLGAGTAFLLLGRSQAASFDQDKTCDVADSGAVTGGGQCQSLYDSWRTNRTVGIVGLAVGGVLAATSTVLFIKSRSASDAAPSAQAFVACTPAGNAAVACSFRF